MTTLAITFVILLLCLVLLGIGALCTGKCRFKLGMCGRTPSQGKGKECGTDSSCSICGKDDDKTVQ